CQCGWQSRRGSTYAKHLVAGGDQPVQQRCLLKIPDAIYVERYKVSCERHLARRLCVSRIRIVEQCWSEHRNGINQQEKQQDSSDRAGRRYSSWPLENSSLPY